MFDIHERVWSPYAAGIVIGLLQIPAILLIHTALGASSAYVMVADYLVSIAGGCTSGQADRQSVRCLRRAGISDGKGSEAVLNPRQPILGSIVGGYA